MCVPLTSSRYGRNPGPQALHFVPPDSSLIARPRAAIILTETNSQPYTNPQTEGTTKL